MKYFLKELLDNPISVPSGQRVMFEDVGGNMGVLETNNKYLIDELKNAEARSIGGVYEIDEEKFKDLKKKANSVSLSKKSFLKVVKQSPIRTPESEQSGAAGDDVGQPLDLPDQIPTTRKIKRGRPKKVKKE